MTAETTERKKGNRQKKKDVALTFKQVLRICLWWVLQFRSGFALHLRASRYFIVPLTVLFCPTFW